MNENPFDSPAPKSPIDRIHAFARDLAYGVTIGKWGTGFNVAQAEINTVKWSSRTEHIGGQKNPFIVLQHEKWEHNPPAPELLESFGFLEHSEDTQWKYRLTNRAFDLLLHPVTPPTIFISYKRGESSTFALLVEARLRHIGVPTPFLDKSIAAGEQWHALLEERILGSKIFICLVGVEALKSPFVQKEIELAEKAGCRIISIWDGCTLDTSPHPILSKYQVIIVKGNSADDYETAISRLLNDLGYSTY